MSAYQELLYPYNLFTVDCFYFFVTFCYLQSLIAVLLFLVQNLKFQVF